MKGTFVKLGKRIFELVIVAFMFASPAYAQSIEVTALGDFAAPVLQDKDAVTDLVPAGSIVYANESNGFYGLAPSGDWVALGLKPSATRPEIHLSGGSGRGSTNTTVRRFTTSLVSSGGSAITYAPSSTNGDTFTIAQAGVYSITYQDSSDTDSGMVFGITKNSSQLSTAPTAITNANVLSLGIIPGTTKWGLAATTVYLAVGDVIRAQAETTADSTHDYKVRFHIVKVTD